MQSWKMDSTWSAFPQNTAASLASVNFKRYDFQRSLKPLVNQARYKTEICRSFEENKSCKYGDKCQFAHGHTEVRQTNRHPKYKTEPCRTFHSFGGFCPYGPRCHFIHSEDQDTLELVRASPGSPMSSSSSYSPMTSPISSSPSLSPTASSFFSEEEPLAPRDASFSLPPRSSSQSSLPLSSPARIRPRYSAACPYSPASTRTPFE